MLPVQVEPAEAMHRDPEHEHDGHHRMTGYQPGNSCHAGKNDQSHPDSVQRPEHGSEPIGHRALRTSV